MKSSKKLYLLAIFTWLLAVAVGCLPANAQSFAYVANSGDNTVSVISTATNRGVATVPVGAPGGVAITPSGAFAYVSNGGGSNTVSVIDTASNTVVATVPVGSAPAGVATTPNGAFAYVPNQQSSTVSVIDTASNTVAATVPVGTFPARVAITPNGSAAYVTNEGPNTVSVINIPSNTVVATVPVGSVPKGVAITPNGAFAYVANTQSNTVSVINTATNTVVATLPVGIDPEELAITPLLDPDSQFSRLNGGNTFTGNQTVNGSVNATNFVGNGVGLTNVAAATAANASQLGGVAAGNYARLDIGNHFQGNQSIAGNVTLNGNQAIAGNVGVNIAPIAGAGIQSLGSQYGVLGSVSGNAAVAGVAGTGGSYGVQGVGNLFGVVAVGNSGALWASTTGFPSTAVLAASQSAPGVNTAAPGVFNNLAGGNIFIGQNNGVNKITIDGNGSLATQGSVAIGGGTPIIEHLSQTPTITVPPIGPNNCVTLPPVTFSAASDGDTIALGVKNALTSGGNLTYFAWVSASSTISIKVCNPHGTTNSSLTGTIRVDIWKH